MGRKDFENSIIKLKGWILSEGTLNLQHLIPKAYDILEEQNIEGDRAEEIRNEIRKVFGHEDPTFYKQFYGEVKFANEDQEREAVELWNETIYNFFNNIAPDGYYFGSHEGDGACIGWWECEEYAEPRELIIDPDNPILHDPSEYPPIKDRKGK